MLRRIFFLSMCFLVVGVCYVIADTQAKIGLVQPEFGEAFNKQWRDGHAELAAYQLKYPQYRQLNDGKAVTIFVTEKLRRDTLVKDDWPTIEKDSFEVVKLNLIEDFSTGIYDYNLMTSTFVNTSEANGLAAGSLMKISYSQQEWCGHLYFQTLFKGGKAHLTGNSYWEGQEAIKQELQPPEKWVSYDALWHWARGLAAPYLKPGETIELKILSPVKETGMRRKTYRWLDCRLTRGVGTKTIKVPAGEFKVEAFTVDIQNGYDTLRFEVEAEGQRRIIRWTGKDGYEASLLGSKRLKYWEMNRKGMEKTVKAIGLTPVKPQSP